MKRMLILAALATTACGTHPPRPVDIESADMCSFCKMAISQKRYAAELLDHDGNAFKFDDIGCMIRFAGKRGLKDNGANFFVMDYDSRIWLAAARAHFVKSEAIPSPMASGLFAVADQSTATEYAGKFRGRVLAFAELWQ